MRVRSPRYPVDRYLVESSNKIEMVNLIDDDLWKAEPALRPEDELMLRQLQDILHSTAEDLKLLTAELAQSKQPRLLLKQQPTPLDEEFNEKVHVEQIVNAKFHGHKILDKASLMPDKSFVPNLNVTYSKPNVNTGVQVNTVPVVKNTNKLKRFVVTRPRLIEIKEKLDKNDKNQLNNGKIISNKIKKDTPTIAYTEFTYQHEEPKVESIAQNKLKIQDMPSINIRGELKTQKVLQLDIYPENEKSINNEEIKSNVAVVAVGHETVTPDLDPKITLCTKTIPVKVNPQSKPCTKPLVRKVSKMTCESSESTNNVSSDTKYNLKTQEQIKTVIKSSPKTSTRDRVRTKKTNLVRKESEKRTHLNVDEWKKKLNAVYGRPTTSKMSNKFKHKSPKQSEKPVTTKSAMQPEITRLNNAPYIPYSQLTLGGVRVSDIEREISNIPLRNDMPLSPILDKILSSRENSFHKESPRKSKQKHSPRIFTTSDENLLEEVIDLERNVSKTINKNKEIAKQAKKLSSESNEEDKDDDYADDFEEDAEDDLVQKDGESSSETEHHSNVEVSNHNSDMTRNRNTQKPTDIQEIPHGNTRTKKAELSFKKSVDVFEFIHSVERQDSATQSNAQNRISLKETQTSPTNGNSNRQVQPIHNDLWPLDPKGEVEKMFKLEKDFIKKLILEEYGDMIAKPSTSKESQEEKQRNIASFPKVTQTSPARAKSVMTSPTRTKTRTTSPFLSVKVDHQTSPMVVVTNEEQLVVEVDNDEDGISINLSSPRFSLRLPQSSREILTNPESVNHTAKSERKEKSNNTTTKTYRRIVSSSSSEVENSSEISSLGEVKFKLKRRYRKRVSSISESSEASSKTSSDLPSGDILPMRSEGEVSFKHLMKKVSNKTSKSEGETSVGRVT